MFNKENSEEKKEIKESVNKKTLMEKTKKPSEKNNKNKNLTSSEDLSEQSQELANKILININKYKKFNKDSQKDDKKTHSKFSFSKLNIFAKFKKKNKERNEEKSSIKQKEKKALIQERRQKLKFYIEKASVDINPETLPKKIFNICIAINLIFTVLLVYHFSVTFGISRITIFVFLTVLWTLVFLILLYLIWAVFYLILDLKIYNRKNEIERVHPIKQTRLERQILWQMK